MSPCLVERFVPSGFAGQGVRYAGPGKMLSLEKGWLPFDFLIVFDDW